MLFILFFIYIYVASITLLPKSIVLIEGEKLDLATLWGISLKQESTTNPNLEKIEEIAILEASTAAEENTKTDVGKIDLDLNFLDTITLKEISVNVIPKTKVIPLGNAIGVKLYTQGVLVVGMTQIDGKKPYENTGIEEGDRIISVNNKTISSTQDLIETVNASQGKEITLKYVRKDVEETVSIIPVETEENEYKLGLWVRDAAAGVGTLSFYIPETKMFACLGHGITDVDTSDLITISNGELVTTNIVSIQKGQKGKPRRNKR